MVSWNWDELRDGSGDSHESITNTDNSNSSIYKQGYSYQAPPLMDGLVGWWPLHDETAQDYSGSGNHGTINGATTGVAGRSGLQATSFDGSDDNINIGDTSVLNGTGSKTVSLWVYVRDTSSFQRIFNNEGGFEGYYIAVDSNNALSFVTSDGSASNVASSSFAPSTGTWYHIVGVYDDSGPTNSIYVNGTLENSTSVTSMADPNGQTASVGNYANTSVDYLNGVVCDVRVYDRTLSQSEIQTLYEWGSVDTALPPDNTNGGVAYYALDGDATDSWGSNDGTVNGATITSNAIRGQAYSFDTDDSIVVSDNTNLDTIKTVSLWTNESGNESNDYPRFLYKDIYPNDYTNDKQIDFFRHRINGEYSFSVGDGSNNYRVFWSTPRKLSGWHHWVLMANTSSERLSIYHNGVLVASDTGPSSLASNTNDLRIGTGENSQFLNGIVDDVRIYDSVLFPNEVFELYQFGTFGRDMRDILVRA